MKKDEKTKFDKAVRSVSPSSLSLSHSHTHTHTKTQKHKNTKQIIKKLRTYAMLDRSEKLREELEKLKKGEEEKKEDCCISNFPNRKMYTPLHIAASRGSLKSMKVLLDFGIDVNILDNKDNTALHEACRTGHSASAELLIKNSMNIKMKNHIGATALHFACMKGMSK